MSSLDEQLKELQNRKLKSEFLKVLKTKIGDITESRFKDIEKEVKDDLFAFIDSHIDMIETGQVKNKQEISNGLFSDEQVNILMKLANKALERNQNLPPQQTQNNVYNQENQQQPIQQPTQPVDPIRFAMNLRHLDGKEVAIKSMQNQKGQVRGLDAPHVVVQLQNGQTVRVIPEDLIVS